MKQFAVLIVPLVARGFEFGFAGYRPYNPSEGAVVCNNVWRKEKELVTQMIKLASWVGGYFTAAKVSELEDQLPKTMEALLNKQLAGCSPLMEIWSSIEEDVCDLSKRLIRALINLQIYAPTGLSSWVYHPSIPTLAKFDSDLAETVTKWTASSPAENYPLNAELEPKFDVKIEWAKWNVVSGLATGDVSEEDNAESIMEHFPQTLQMLYNAQ